MRNIGLEIALLIVSSLIPQVGASGASTQCSNAVFPGNIRTLGGIMPFLASAGFRFAHGRGEYGNPKF